MSIFSDYACGAMDDFEFENACTAMNNREAVYEQEHQWDEYKQYEEE